MLPGGVNLRVGLGHDTHRLEPGRKLILGGVEIDFELGLAGHSDADVLLHAITDALIGAVGAGDIGEHFPDTDPQFKDVDSGKLLQEIVDQLIRPEWHISNLDCTIFAERPKLSPYKKQIENSIGELLDLSVNLVNVKAKTGEKVGPIGRGEAISASVIVLLAGQS